MLMMGKPKNIDNYICVNSRIANKLHELNYLPVYRDMGNIYFTKTEELEEVVRKFEKDKV